MREIGTLHRAISMLRIDTPAAPLGSSNTIHVSIPSDSPTCANLGLPTPPPGWVYRCVSAANLRNIDNTGWIPIDFTVMPRGSPLASLPIDPVNTVASSNFYVFVTDGRTWTLASLMESERHAPTAARDGGTDFARFEAGTNLSLWTSASGLVGYWNFDEGAGTTARDLSGRGNTGTLQPALGPTWTTGRVAGGLSFDGVDDFVNVPHSSSINLSTYTYEFWIRPREVHPLWRQIINKGSGNIIERAPGIWFEPNSLRVSFKQTNSLTTDIRIGSVRALTLNTWSHVVIVQRTNYQAIYINGMLSTESHVAFTPHLNIGSLRMGLAGDAPALMDLDEVRIYNRALTEAEIRASFNATR